MIRDLDRVSFEAKLRKAGFVWLPARQIGHPEIAGGGPLQFSIGSRRRTLAELTVQLLDARARRRGGRFIRSAFGEPFHHLMDAPC